MKKLVTLCSEQSLIPILEGDSVLQYISIQKLLREIQPISQLADDQFTEIYSQLIVRFAAFVQMIPDICNGRLGALFDEGLKRADWAIRMQSLENSAESDPLFTYALFSAAMLLDLRKVLSNKRIMLTDAKGVFVNEWLPYTDFMQKEEASYYQVRSYHRPLMQLSPYNTLLLARQVMPESGFLWLSQDIKIFNMWLAGLCGDEQGAGSLGHILQLVKIRLLEQSEEKPKFIMPVEIVQPEEHALAEEFWVWLKQIIGNQATEEVGPSVHITEDLVFLDVPKIFQLFCEQTQKLPVQNWQEIYHQFLQLGIATSTRDEKGMVPPDQLMIYLTKNELAPQQQSASDKKKMNKGFFVQAAETAKLAQEIKKQDQLQAGNKTSADQKEAIRKEYAQRERDYKDQEKVVVEFDWFKKTRRIDMQQRLKEIARNRKLSYQKMKLKLLIARIMLRRTLRMSRKF